MKIFEIIVLIGIIVLIVLGAVFSESMFRNLSLEGTNSTDTTGTITTYGQTYAWIYAIAALLVLAVIILALKLLREQVTT